MSQDNSSKKTVCLGRYLIDLPADATIKSSFKYANGFVETKLNFTQSSFEQVLSNRENSLKNTLHKLGGTMLVGRTELAKNRVLIQSWTDATTTQNILNNEIFIYEPEGRVYFLNTVSSSASGQAELLKITKRIAERYKFRNQESVPMETGFAINSGLISGNATNREAVSSVVNLKQFPSISVSFNSQVTGAPSGGLLDRSNNAMASLDPSVAANITTLRKTARNIGPVKGEEILISGNEDGKRSFEFNWQSEGLANSIEFPSMRIRLSTADKTNANAELVDAPFKTDKEALDYWDALLNTLRLRPGAV